MPEYWVIVRRGNPELLQLLSTAFRGRHGFSVIVDRRQARQTWRAGDRRGQRDDWDDDNFLVAERIDVFG